ITEYFLKRRQLISAFVLIDIRHDPQPIDLQFMEWLGENSIPFGIIFTKADKLKPNAINRQVEGYLKTMTDGAWEEAPVHFVTSSLKATGRDEILEYIGQINSDFFSHQG
ncbi:GTP-binding protein, partial [Muriicola sp.]